MTKKHSKDTEADCIACDSFSYFTNLIKRGNSTEEAFYDAMGLVAEDIEETVSEIMYSEGFDDGFLESYRVIARQMEKTVTAIEEFRLRECGECDCDDGCELDG